MQPMDPHGEQLHHRGFHPRGVERFENVHKRNESVGGRPHVQHVYQRASHHVCTPAETALALVQLRDARCCNSGMDHVLQHFETT